jgi:hypothetical protein
MGLGAGKSDEFRRRTAAAFEGGRYRGWLSVVTRLIAAMEHDQVRSLMRSDSKSARPTAERITGLLLKFAEDDWSRSSFPTLGAEAL